MSPSIMEVFDYGTKLRELKINALDCIIECVKFEELEGSVLISFYR